jgi:hypothetical protein
LPEDMRARLSIAQIIDELRLIDDFQFQQVNEYRKIRHYFTKEIYIPHYFNVTSYYRLQKAFYRQIGGNTESIYSSPFDPGVSFEHCLIALAMLRGDTGLELHLASLTAELMSILKVTNAGVHETEWASIVLLAAYFDRIEPLSDQNLTPDTKKVKVSELFISADELRRTRSVLDRYLSVLNGETLTAGLTEAPSGEAATLGFFEGFVARTAALDQRFAWSFFAILLLALLPELWRAGNFVLRGLLNYRLLVLVRESKEFLQALEFSEGREASAGFNFRGIFNLSGTRTLTARALTLQSLTDRYHTYVESLLNYYNDKLIVIIDELDKMTDPNDVKKVLLELKGALFQRGCYYMISISEDSAKAFRGRLIEGRDIFESTFEDVITIRELAPSAARAMVHNRLKTDESAPKLSNAAIDILTVFSGAIPREIVRHLRDTVLNAEGRKPVSPKVIGRNILEREIRQWMDQLRTAPYAGDQLIALRENCRGMLDALPESTRDDWPDQTSPRVARNAVKSIGVALAECLRILDPDGKWRSEEIVSKLETDSDAESRKAFRSLAELQACLRLMIMNELMRHVWKFNRLDDVQSRAATMCLRTVMVQPAIAERMLIDLSVEKLRQIYPEEPPTRPPTLAEAAAE